MIKKFLWGALFGYTLYAIVLIYLEYVEGPTDSGGPLFYYFVFLNWPPLFVSQSIGAAFGSVFQFPTFYIVIPIQWGLTGMTIGILWSKAARMFKTFQQKRRST